MYVEGFQTAAFSNPLYFQGIGGHVTASVTSAGINDPVNGTGAAFARPYLTANPAALGMFSGGEAWVGSFETGYNGAVGESPDTLTLSFDFTALSTGWLSSGSLVALGDPDLFESATVLAFADGSQIVTDWLTGTTVFDAVAPVESNFTGQLTYDGAGGYTYTAPGSGMDWWIAKSFTTRTVDRIDIVYRNYDPSNSTPSMSHLIGMNLATVPEPSAASLACLAGLVLVRRRRSPVLRFL